MIVSKMLQVATKLKTAKKKYYAKKKCYLVFRDLIV